MFRTSIHRLTTPLVQRATMCRYFSMSAVQRSPTLLYSEKHEWVRVDNGKVQLGITDSAQDKLGEITHMDLKINVGDTVNEGDVVAEIESVKAVSDVYSTVSGTVSAINQEALDNPTIINESPEEKGWILELEPTNFEAEKTALLDKVAYDKFCAEADE